MRSARRCGGPAPRSHPPVGTPVVGTTSKAVVVGEQPRRTRAKDQGREPQPLRIPARGMAPGEVSQVAAGIRDKIRRPRSNL